MSIKVINGGLMTTVQDQGRYGMQAGGMQVSGCMDNLAARIANELVGNAANCAVLETTYLGPELEFTEKSLVAVAGGEPDVQLAGKAVSAYKAIIVQPGQHLKVNAQKKGMRAYIAVAGGLDVPEVLGSRSTNLKLKIGGVAGGKIQPGDEIPVGTPGEYAVAALAGKKALRQDAVGFGSGQSEILEIRAVAGPQEDYFSPEEYERLQQEIYTVSNESDRMGYRLEGRPVEKTRQQDLITDGIVFGSVQIPPNGQPIIMLADHQTTGGYPKIATVATVDLPKLAQAMPGTKLQFKIITVQEAQRLLREQHEKLNNLLTDIRNTGENVQQYGSKAKEYNLKINGQSFHVVVEPI